MSLRLRLRPMSVNRPEIPSTSKKEDNMSRPIIGEVQSWCHQKSKVARFIHVWTIENFSAYPSQIINGKMFSVPDDEEYDDATQLPDGSHYQWRLQLNPKITSDHEGLPQHDFVGIYLELIPEKPPNSGVNRPLTDAVVKAKFAFSILGTDGKWHNQIRMLPFVCLMTLYPIIA